MKKKPKKPIKKPVPVSDILDKFWKMVDTFCDKHKKEMAKYQINLTYERIPQNRDPL